MHGNRLHQAMALAVMCLLLTSRVFTIGQEAVPDQSSDLRISAAEVADLMSRGAALVIVDVREPELFRRGHLPGARLAPPDQWRDVALELKNATAPIVTYCSCPQEESSLRAAARFKELGVRNVRALTGGYEAWAAAGRPVVTPAGVAQARSNAPSGSATHDANRESWQRVPDIFAAMGIGPGSRVADVGAGDGFFTTRLGAAVGPAGRVYAVDISQNALARLATRVKDQGLTNVEAILGAADDPKLPEGALDAVLIVNAYHEMQAHQAMLTAIQRALKPGGRLVILESVMPEQRGQSRESQESRHQLAPNFLQRDLLDAGFVIMRFEDEFTRRGGNHSEYMVVASRAPVPAGY
jgi:rhodanese-related sulfurtransferase/precorrin-6B methylase 2